MKKQIIGRDIPANDFHHFMNTWSINQAEKNHVETIEEANDFEIYDEEDESPFPQDLTVYEMHEIQEEALQILEAEQKMIAAESNDSADQGAETQPPHDQSAPDDNAMLQSETTPLLSK